MTQPQREALLDLLHIALLTDSHISLKEDEQLQTVIDAIGWSSPRPREIHMLNSMAKARRASDSAETSAEFIAARATHFHTAASQEEAVTALQSLLSSDGLSTEETAFIAQLRSLFPQE